MATLQWGKELELEVPEMDQTHREFVDLLAEVESAQDAQLLTLWNGLIEHTNEHFAQEDRWMAATGFTTGNCHSTQHKVVLDIMREGRVRAENGDLTMIRGMTPELASWFSYHAQTMDAALAQHMTAVGFDINSGQLLNAQSLPAEAISGCGGACSSPADHHTQTDSVESLSQAAV